MCVLAEKANGELGLTNIFEDQVYIQTLGYIRVYSVVDVEMVNRNELKEKKNVI